MIDVFILTFAKWARHFKSRPFYGTHLLKTTPYCLPKVTEQRHLLVKWLEFNVEHPTLYKLNTKKNITAQDKTPTINNEFICANDRWLAYKLEVSNRLVFDKDIIELPRSHVSSILLRNYCQLSNAFASPIFKGVCSRYLLFYHVPMSYFSYTFLNMWILLHHHFITDFFFYGQNIFEAQLSVIKLNNYRW